jgi:cell division septum initiation protein DivIVA
MSIPSFTPGQESGTNGPGWAISQGLDDQAFEAIDQTVRHAAGAIDGLRDILERLQKSVAHATEQRRNDIEIGHLFSKAEEFVEGAVSEGHELAQRIIADAEFEASMIVTAAKEEASRLIAEGRRSTSVPSEAVSALEATIREFARMNKAITDQLALVSGALASQRESRINRSGEWQPQRQEQAPGTPNAVPTYPAPPPPGVPVAPPNSSPATSQWSPPPPVPPVVDQPGRSEASAALWRLR